MSSHAKDTTQAATIKHTSHNQAAPSQQIKHPLLKKKSPSLNQPTQLASA